MNGLTARQQQIFDLIRDHIQTTGYPPTRAEIAEHFGYRSVNAAEQHLKALEKKGMIEIVKGTSRGIRLMDDSPADAGIPIVGDVAAGAPILAQQNVEDYLNVDAAMFSPPADFFLRVRGDSMRDAGILNGDLLAVRSTPEVRDGAIVVARIDDEVTVKRLERRRNTVRLLPENADYEPIEVDLTRQELVIEGLAIGVLRTHL